jgi:hypothetical protein
VSDLKGWNSSRRCAGEVHPTVPEFLVARFILPVVVVTETLPLCVVDAAALVSATLAAMHAAKLIMFQTVRARKSGLVVCGIEHEDSREVEEAWSGGCG